MSEITHIFLDFDGVLNTNGTYKRWRALGGDLDDPEFRHHRLDALFEPRCVAAVNLLVEMLDYPDIVLSTYWRREHELDGLRVLLAQVGFVGNVVGKTPSLTWEVNWEGYQATGRGAEIADYCKRHNIDPSSMLILEDEMDIRPFRGRQVKSTFSGSRAGFGARHLCAGLRLAGHPSVPTAQEAHALVADRISVMLGGSAAGT